MSTGGRTPRSALFVSPALFGLCLLASCAGEDPVPARPNAMHFEGATIVTGDGSVIENGVFIVEDGRITEVGDGR